MDVDQDADDLGFGHAELADWRLVGGRVAAWFAAGRRGSHAAGAALVAAVARSSDTGPAEFDLRANGVRVRIEPDPEAARRISTAAAGLGLSADPSVLGELGLVIQTGDRSADSEDRSGNPSVLSFWEQVLGYQRLPDGGLADPLHRDPPLRVVGLEVPRPLRNRLHLDVGRPAEVVESIRGAVGQQPHGPFGVALDDRDGNEVDLCPGGPLSPGAGTTDWQAMFSALAFYPTATGPAADFVTEVAGIADEAGRPLLIDLRPGGVLIDSGKDQWESETGADPAFVALAARIQQAAAARGLAADPAPYRFIQIGIDAADVAKVRQFWRSVLGYQNDPRPWVTDIYDPNRLNPVIFFQQLDTTETDRLRQRNRLHLELAVAADRVDALIARGLAAGGRLLDPDSEHQQVRGLADPEGNELWLLPPKD